MRPWWHQWLYQKGKRERAVACALSHKERLRHDPVQPEALPDPPRLSDLQPPDPSAKQTPNLYKSPSRGLSGSHRMDFKYHPSHRAGSPSSSPV